ncbi:MAG: hypothetical protein K6T26_02100 [Alicyclobacillus sp.]|nr:hypothetical protein [Alicyclobacillus sp.]
MGELVYFPTSNLDEPQYDVTPPKAPKIDVETGTYVFRIDPLAHSVQWDEKDYRRGGDPMDEGYKRLIDRLDQDMRDHKQEMRDMHAVYQRDAAEREARFREEAKEREDRILAEIRAMREETRGELAEMRKDMRETEQHVRSMVTQNFWGRIATVITILAICFTVASTVWAAIFSVHHG